MAVRQVSVVPAARPDPPPELTKDQALEWRKIVKGMPADWFTMEMWPLLGALCVAICQLKKVTKAVEEIEVGSKHHIIMSKLQNQYLSIIGKFSTKLKLTPQSRHNANASRRATREAVAQRRHKAPWEKTSRGKGLNGAQT